MPARHGFWLVACDSRGAPGRPRASGSSAWCPCLAAAARRPADSGLALGSPGGRRRAGSARCALASLLQPCARRRAATHRARSPFPGTWPLPGLPADSRLLMLPESHRSRCGSLGAGPSPYIFTPRSKEPAQRSPSLEVLFFAGKSCFTSLTLNIFICKSELIT